ncbi:hypothetical protein [Massilia sp. TN1-12]|uniref:hypothetical protein n=1 Tax=Massilia paldalensis TaxID=3377675 RepID=UPI0038513318
MHALPSTDAAARLAGRATGAMFFFGFGGLWLEGWAQRSHAGVPWFVGIAVLAILSCAFAWRRYRRYAPALARQEDTPQRRRAKRVFNIVNAAQWIVILVLGNVMANLGYGAWVIPMVIVVVGLHFLPLAHVFAYWPHFATGAAMVGFALLYPFIASGGPASPLGFLGAGLILWCSAAWALRAA